MERRIPDYRYELNPKLILKTRQQKVQFLKDVTAGRKSLKELKPEVHVTQFFKKISADTYRSCDTGDVFTKEELEERTKTIDCTHVTRIIFKDMSGTKY